MKICPLDIETTSLLSPEHRIVEFYGALWEEGTKARLREVTKRIHPQRTILAEASRVHGIAIEDLAGCPVWHEVAPEIHALMAEADLLVAHNGKAFDLPFLNMEFERVGLPVIKTPLVDTMLEGRWATASGKVPNLAELCFACDVPYDPAKAHAAAYDVDVMTECFFRATAWGWFKITEREVA